MILLVEQRKEDRSKFLIGYPEWWLGKKGGKSTIKARLLAGRKTGRSYSRIDIRDYQLFLKHFSGTGNSEGTKPVANMAHKEDEEGEWIFDSGCTEYITYLSDILVNKKTTHFEAPVVIPNGDSIPVKGKEDYILPGGTKVNGVLFVLISNCNLLFFPYHKAFLAAITNNDEPKCFKQAAQDARWREAMKKEVKALEKNGTWTLEYLPEGKRAIDSKWVYKIKFKPNGEVEKYKARVVAKGFNQMEGFKKGWIIHQLDVNNAFLHGDLDEEVYMKIPQGFSNDNETRVCRLRKSLYGLKQASRNWYHKFTTFLRSLNFRQSKADHSLFIYEAGSTMVVVLIYVDDVIITGNNLTKIQETKKQLDYEFSIKDLGPLKYFLGIEVAKTRDGLVLSQRKYTLDILKNSGKSGCKPSAFPIEEGLKLDKGESESLVDASQYRRLIGRLLYLQATRPDITYIVNILSQFVVDPRNNHLEAANRVLGYLKATPGQGILLSRAGDPILTAYCDSDWLGCPYTRRSRTDYLLLLGGTPISWRTNKQYVVSRSFAEAEYKAMASTVSEIIWVRWLLSELHVHNPLATPLFCDNQAAWHIANNPVFHERTKHVKIDCYFVHERVESMEIIPMKTSSKMQIADLLTKGLPAHQLQFLLGKIGITDLHAPS
ncbi:putative RNA-directed DNA polymerase [Tanacetum coccineum]